LELHKRNTRSSNKIMTYADGNCTREPTRTIDDAVDEAEASII
jgi:hypothetical protein